MQEPYSCGRVYLNQSTRLQFRVGLNLGMLKIIKITYIYIYIYIADLYTCCIGFYVLFVFLIIYGRPSLRPDLKSLKHAVTRLRRARGISEAGLAKASVSN